MGAFRRAATAAAMAWLVAPAVAQETPRLGEWLDPGAYCAHGVRAVVPDGYEAISFGNGLEVRPIGVAGDVLELTSFPKSGEMPPFESFVERLQLACKEGFRAERITEMRDAGGDLTTLDVLIRRCVGPSTSYGFYFSRAGLKVEGAEHDASVMTLFGDEPFDMGRVSFTEDAFFAEEAASELFETMTSGLAACPIEEPPAPPAPPEPTAWLGAGDHCAFSIGATAPDGFEFRFNGLASNGGTIDLRLAGVDEPYHRSKIFVWPLHDETLDPPEASTAFDSCPQGYAPERRREELGGGDAEPIHVLVEGCFSPDGEYYGAMISNRLLALPIGDHQVRGAFTIGSPNLPRNLAWTEFKAFTEDEVRAVIDGFIGSMRACRR